MAGLSNTSATWGGLHGTTRLAVAYADFVLAFRTLFDPYRPERHYMRGPGPKWQAKYCTKFGTKYGSASIDCH
jgi:hypothetical protein